MGGRRDEVGPGQATGEGPLDGELEAVARLEAEFIAERGERDEAFDLVIAVGPAPGDAERQIELGLRRFAVHRHGGRFRGAGGGYYSAIFCAVGTIEFAALVSWPAGKPSFSFFSTETTRSLSGFSVSDCCH